MDVKGLNLNLSACGMCSFFKLGLRCGREPLSRVEGSSTRARKAAGGNAKWRFPRTPSCFRATVRAAAMRRGPGHRGKRPRRHRIRHHWNGDGPWHHRCRQHGPGHGPRRCYTKTIPGGMHFGYTNPMECSPPPDCYRRISCRFPLPEEKIIHNLPYSIYFPAKL